MHDKNTNRINIHIDIIIFLFEIPILKKLDILRNLSLF